MQLVPQWMQAGTCCSGSRFGRRRSSGLAGGRRRPCTHVVHQCKVQAPTTAPPPPPHLCRRMCRAGSAAGLAWAAASCAGPQTPRPSPVPPAAPCDSTGSSSCLWAGRQAGRRRPQVHRVSPQPEQCGTGSQQATGAPALAAEQQHQFGPAQAQARRCRRLAGACLTASKGPLG